MNVLNLIATITILTVIISIALFGKNILSLISFKTATTPNKESNWILFVTGALTIITAVTQYLKTKPEVNILIWIGIAVYLLGIILKIAAYRQLKENTLEEKLAQTFELKGIYAKIRHPNKTALIMIITGICIAMQSKWAIGILILLFLPSVFYRISQEEKILHDKFDEKWINYKEDTKKLIPWIL